VYGDDLDEISQMRFSTTNITLNKCGTRCFFYV